ncbi:MAG: (2Fe-2S) ferredoxin domain-containing protein [Leptolyngbyaceae cyanobacterium SM1_1_3]|nr:(2Fe-2S) ferredoxin domain-containing protein [Leptolyngbyaceae cyanobacterium SM1_1_3]NJN01348.1 (2Fe-2S) ferredoxin domain-containing protein [Leptolyngbyaceae cyanobacterium RM1_1_2]NJO10700.1 (2Fe-2S) ferredoxin domain-containing protein [Leptolyngbyaceae cyanobacterium SL_1_1]
MSLTSDAVTSSPTPRRRCLLICQNRSCLRNDADRVLAAFQTQTPLSIFVSPSACLGQCSSGPTVKVMPDDIWYCQVSVADVPEIIEQHLLNDQPLKRLLHPRFHPQHDACPQSE